MNADMNFLLDENIPPRTCILLRNMGFTVHHVHIDDLFFAVGRSDNEVYCLAQKNSGVIITLNRKHFSTFDPSCCGGIFLLKVKPTTAAMINDTLDKFFRQHFSESLLGTAIIITLMNDGTIKVRRVKG